MNEYRLNLRDFYNTLLVLKELYKVNIITGDELRHIEGMMRTKYGIKDNSVFSLNTVAI
ncbi:MAG: SHOCT domain-containing protein [Bacilli bacterium]